MSDKTERVHVTHTFHSWLYTKQRNTDTPISSPRDMHMSVHSDLTCNSSEMETTIMSNLVCLGCYTKIPSTGWLINNLFLTSLESGKLKIKVLAYS